MFRDESYVPHTNSEKKIEKNFKKRPFEDVSFE